LGKGRESGTGPQGKTTAAKAKLLWNSFSLNVASAKSQKLSSQKRKSQKRLKEWSGCKKSAIKASK